MTQFEFDLQYVNDVVYAIRFVVENRIYDNRDYKRFEFPTYFDVHKNFNSVMQLHKKSAFGISMTNHRTIQVNTKDKHAALLDFDNYFGEKKFDLYDTPISEEQYFQDSLILPVEQQRETLLISKIREYLLGTKYESIEIDRTKLDAVITDAKQLPGVN